MNGIIKLINGDIILITDINCKNVDDLFKSYGCQKGSYSEFTRWFKKMKYHVEMYKKSKKK